MRQPGKQVGEHAKPDAAQTESGEDLDQGVDADDLTLPENEDPQAINSDKEYNNPCQVFIQDVPTVEHDVQHVQSFPSRDNGQVSAGIANPLYPARLRLRAQGDFYSENIGYNSAHEKYFPQGLYKIGRAGAGNAGFFALSVQFLWV